MMALRSVNVDLANLAKQCAIAVCMTLENTTRLKFFISDIDEVEAVILAQLTEALTPGNAGKPS